MISLGFQSFNIKEEYNAIEEMEVKDKTKYVYHLERAPS